MLSNSSVSHQFYNNDNIDFAFYIKRRRLFIDDEIEQNTRKLYESVEEEQRENLGKKGTALNKSEQKMELYIKQEKNMWIMN